MKLYNYSKETGEFLSESEAYLDPLESEQKKENVYLVPANATLIEPPKTKAKEVAVFESGVWIVKPDLRGSFSHDPITKEDFVVDYIGEIKSEHKAGKYVASKEEILAKARLAKIDEIQSRFKDECLKVCICNVGSNVYQMDADLQDSINLKHGIELVESLGKEEITIRDFNDQDVIVSIEEAKSINREQSIYFDSMRMKKNELKTKISKSTINELKKISW